MKGSQSKPCWSTKFCLQVTRCRTGLGLDVPCQVQCLCGAKAQWTGNPFYTLTSLTTNHSRVWNPTLIQLAGERVLLRELTSPPRAWPCQAVSGAAFSLIRQQWMVLSQPSTQQRACPVSRTCTHSQNSPPCLSPPHFCLLYWADQISHMHRAHTSFQSTCFLRQACPLFSSSNTPLLLDQTGLNTV